MTLAKQSESPSTGGLANRDTPLIRNAWYVAAMSSEITREMSSRWILERNVLLFRREDGTAMAMQNRCPHRSFPLSKGTLEGDTVVCGYHGLRYDCSGRCIEVPSQEQAPSDKLRLRVYPLVEKGPLAWIWMGEPELADPALIPFQSWMDDSAWSVVIGYLHVRGSYVHLHENLLDLSHLSFLHGKTFGTPEYARAPCEMRIDGSDIQVWRHVECFLPPIYAKPLGWEGVRAQRSSGSRFVTPALHVNTGIFTRLDGATDNSGFTPSVQVAQLITPESRNVTHYYYAVHRNFALGDEEIGRFMLAQQTAAFEEDRLALEYIEEFEARDGDADFRQVSVMADKAALAMLRELQRLARTQA